MADENRTAAAAPFPDEVVQVRHVPCDGERPVTAGPLKRLEHVPPFAERLRQRREVAGRPGTAVQHDHRSGSAPVFPHDEVGHPISSVSAWRCGSPACALDVTARLMSRQQLERVYPIVAASAKLPIAPLGFCASHGPSRWSFVKMEPEEIEARAVPTGEDVRAG
jgi:hypothetical protein